MSSPSDRPGAEDDRGRRTAADAIALMWALEVVEAHEALERTVQHATAGEVSPAEGHTPVFMQDGLLQPLDEAIRPGMPRLGAVWRMPWAEQASSKVPLNS